MDPTPAPPTEPPKPLKLPNSCRKKGHLWQRIAKGVPIVLVQRCVDCGTERPAFSRA